MFSGIVESTGRADWLPATGGSRRVRVRFEGPALALRPGESVAVAGVCLTVVTASDIGFESDVGPETRSRTTLGGLPHGALVNLECALRADSRLGGHVVLGHVDGVGTITSYSADSASRRMVVSVPPELRIYLASQGSVTVEGVSLTIAALTAEGFEAMLIPFTLASTTLGGLVEGSRVNIEVDVLARYVERQLAALGTRPLRPPADLAELAAVAAKELR